jgi:hypothetical protein
MDPFPDKQAEIDRRADAVAASYPSQWSSMITEWRQPGPEDRAWLLYSANYLFRTGKVRWGIDPLRLRYRLPGAPEMPATDLKDLSFLLLTHPHSDHLDPDLLRQLVAFPILWVVPPPVLAALAGKVEIPASRLVVPEPMNRIEIDGVRITPFDGLHLEKQPGTDSLRGVPATGYLVECKRWLFPGDTRTYNAGQLPSFGPVNVLFAHLWLGRSAALLEDPPLLEEFCWFCVHLLPERIILAHLDEFGRDANELWDFGHAQKVSAWFQKEVSSIPVSPAFLGDSIKL